MTASNKRNAKPLIVTVAVIAALVLLAGAVLLTVTLVTEAKTVIRYKNVRADAGTVNCLASYYKSRVIGAMNAAGAIVYDEPEFWAADAGDGKTYGEVLTETTVKYLSETLVAAALYDSYHGYTASDKDAVKAAVNEVVSFRADGDRDAFSKLCADYGFGYKEFSSAAAILYKAAKAKTAIYGEDGVKLSYLSEECNEFLTEYSHVHMIVIRDKDTFVLDGDGNRVKGEDGNDLTRPLTSEEATERLNAVQKLRAAIAAKESGGDVQISETMFFGYQQKYDDADAEANKTGYYFLEGSNFTEEFRAEYPELVECALAMPVGSYREVSVPFGNCFLYRSPVVEDACFDTGLDSFFSDFFALAADKSYRLTLETLSENVVFDEKFGEIDLISLLPNSLYTVRF